MQYQIVPLTQISSISLGADRESIRTHMNSPYSRTYKVAGESRVELDAFDSKHILVYYNQENKASGIEFWRGAELEWNGLRVLEIPFPELKARLQEVDQSLIHDEDGFISNKLGIAAYAPIGSPLGECSESIYFFAAGSYPQIGNVLQRSDDQALRDQRREFLQTLLSLEADAAQMEGGAFRDVMSTALSSADILNPFRVPVAVPYQMAAVPAAMKGAGRVAVQMLFPSLLMKYEHYRLSSIVGRSPIAEAARRARSEDVGEEHPKAIKEIRGILSRLLEMNGSERERFLSHIASNLGDPQLFHTSEAAGLTIELLYVAPTKERPLHTFITYGMSSRPLNAPAEEPHSSYLELMISLPSAWPIDEESMKTNEFSWPLTLLLFLARYPHLSQRWLWAGHTIPANEPPAPYATNTKLTSCVILPPLLAPPSFGVFEGQEKVVRIFTLVPLYQEELELKLEQGLDALLDRFNQYKILDYVNPYRVNTITGELDEEHK